MKMTNENKKGMIKPNNEQKFIFQFMFSFGDIFYSIFFHNVFIL